jgi:predicted peptidase
LVKSQDVNQTQIYVTGLSMGGFGSFAAVARRPDFFAAAMPVCGGGDRSTAAAMKAVPFWVFHGEADKVVPLGSSETMVEALRKAGGSVKFRKYPGVGHDSWSATYGDPAVWEWLFSQKKK